MFSSRKCKFLIIIHLIILFEHNYLFLPVEAVHGVIWSKNESDFVEIFSIQSFEKINKQRLSISHELETHDFNGTTLKFTSFEIQNLVTFVSNDTVISGVHGDMWQLLAEMFNFKIHSRRLFKREYGSQSKNGSWDGLMGYIYRNETDVIPRCAVSSTRLTALDYTFSTWITAYRFHVKEQLKYHRTWMAELFTRKLWFSVVGFFFTLTLASFSIHVLNFKSKNSRDSISNLRDHIFYIFSIFCIQGWTPQQLEKRSKILIISIRLFAWLIVIAFSSKLISHIAQREFHPPFNDLESFYKDTDYKLLVKRNSLIYSVFKSSPEPIYKAIMSAGRIIQANTSEIYKKTCNGKYVYLESQDVIKAENSRLCVITSFGTPYLTTWIAAGLVRGFKYRKTINLGMMKLQEFGIMNRVKLNWLSTPKAVRISNTVESTRVEHVSLIFALLCCALVLSLLLLIIENIFYFESSHGRRRRSHSCHN